MKKGIVIGIIVAVVLLSVGAAAFVTDGFGLIKKNSSGGRWVPITVTQSNVASVMSQSSLVNDIPDDGIVTFYIGDTGYTITKGKMSSGVAANSDIIIRMPESYLKVLGQSGWCVALQEASRNGDLGIELQGSTANIAWKYRGLKQYRLCLG